jgi:hypothetical protein
MQTNPLLFNQPSEIVEIISFERLNLLNVFPKHHARCKVTTAQSSSTCMLNHNIVEILLVLDRPVRQRYVLNAIGLSTDAIGLPYLDRLVQVRNLKIVKQREQSTSLMEVIVD